MRQADRQRLDRLAGDGNSVVGIDLAALFRVILNQLQDSGGMTRDGLAGPVREALTNHARVEHLYGSNGADPWTALLNDALEQLEAVGLACRREDGTWEPGGKFGTGKRLTVIPSRRGKHGSVGLTLYPAVERASRGEAEKRRMEITSLTASLREDGTGLRPVNQDHVDALAQSMLDFGYRPEFPVIVDQQGRILDGRHRRAAARKAGVAEPPPRVVRFASDEEAFAFAILVNLQRGWTKAERNHIDSVLQTAGLSIATLGPALGTAAKRELTKSALLENPELSHNAIAKRLGYVNAGPMIKAVCDALIIENIISECGHRFTEDGKQAPGPKPKGAPPEPRKVDNPDLEQAVRERVTLGQPVRRSELAPQYNVGAGTVDRVADRVRTELKVSAPAKPPPAALTAESPSEQAIKAVEQMVGIILSLPEAERKWAIAQMLGRLPQQS